MRRLLACAVPLLAAAALFAPAAAQAEEVHGVWYVAGHRAAEYEIVPVQIDGNTTVYFESFGYRATCHASGTGAIENFEGAGGEIVDSMTFTNCRAESGEGEQLHVRACSRGKPFQAAAADLPWAGFTDEDLQAIYEGVAIEFSCGGLEPEEVSGDIAGLVNTHGIQFGEEYDNYLEPDALYTGIWHLTTTEGHRGVTAILPVE